MHISGCIYHAPAVASDQVNAVVQHGTARTAAALQDGGLQDVPLISFRVITFHQHHVQVRESYR